MDSNTANPDLEFVSSLRTAVDAYLAAVDHWEAAFQKHYRMPGCSQNSADMDVEQRDFENRRRQLEALLPRARRLCLRHDQRDPFSGLMRLSLGRFAPQERTDSVIGRGERNAILVCLLELHEACIEWPAESPIDEGSLRRDSPLSRLADYFREGAKNLAAALRRSTGLRHHQRVKRPR